MFLKTVHALVLVVLQWMFCQMSEEQTLASVGLNTSEQCPIPPGANSSAWMIRPTAPDQPVGWEGDPIMCKAAVPKDKQISDPCRNTSFAET